MPWTTLVLVTIQFSIICGNRLMDNRLLRISAASSDLGPFKTLSDNNEFSDSVHNYNSDPELSSLPDIINNDDNYQLDLSKNPNCINEQFVNFLKNERSSLKRPREEEFTMDALTNLGDLQMYENSKALYNGDGIKDNRFFNSILASLPVANYKDFYDDLVLSSYNVNKDMTVKRNGNSILSGMGSAPSRGCDCKVKNDLVDLGQQHFPRYLLNAVCHVHDGRNSDIAPKCWSGSICRPLEYKVKVLTFRTLTDATHKDPTLAWLPDDLRPIWKFKTVTVTAGCFCS